MTTTMKAKRERAPVFDELGYAFVTCRVFVRREDWETIVAESAVRNTKEDPRYPWTPKSLLAAFAAVDVARRCSETRQKEAAP